MYEKNKAMCANCMWWCRGEQNPDYGKCLYDPPEAKYDREHGRFTTIWPSTPKACRCHRFERGE